MNDEIKQLIEDAAKLLGVPVKTQYYGNDGRAYNAGNERTAD